MPIRRAAASTFASRKPLAAAVAAAFALAAPALQATVLVANCNDAGAGSLRAAVAAATDGDTVDARGLDGVCSTITLKTGDIVAAQSTLTIVGPGPDKLTVSARYGNGPTAHQYANRILTHTGTGTLSLLGLTLSNGYVTNPSGVAKGGALYSAGSLNLGLVDVTDSTTHTDSGDAKGGGVFAAGSLTLTFANLRGNTADGGASGAASGGGAYLGGGLAANYSSIMANRAIDTPGMRGFVGGAFAHGDTSIVASTIGNNIASRNIGGLAVKSATARLVLDDSTISGNAATSYEVGGVYAFAARVGVYNSTVAANRAQFAPRGYSPGALFLVFNATPSVTLQSSLFSGNRYGNPAMPNDLTIVGTSATGANNLVLASAAALPPDTIVGACPLLGPLAPNGGFTWTHRLRSHSPAIDAGNDAVGAMFDQRGGSDVNGVRDYVRVSGPLGAPSPRADIGAYEVQQADEIFDSDLEGCP